MKYHEHIADNDLLDSQLLRRGEDGEVVFSQEPPLRRGQERMHEVPNQCRCLVGSANFTCLPEVKGTAGMSESESIRKFEYRPSRIVTGFDVDYASREGTFHGRCRDVSDTGIRAVFDEPLSVGGSGVLILRHPAGRLQIEAQISYVENGQVGFVFVFNSAWEREMTVGFIASIAKHTAGTPVIRFE